MLLARALRSGRRIQAHVFPGATLHLRNVADGSRRYSSQAGTEGSNAWLSSVVTGAGVLVGAVFCSHSAFGESNVAGNFFLTKSPPPPVKDDATSDADMEIKLEEVREALRERMRALRALDKEQTPPVPISVRARGQQIAIKFPVSPRCDVYELVVDLVSRLGGGANLNVRATSSAVARELVISEQAKDSDDLWVVFFDPLIGDKTCEVEFIRKGTYSPSDLDLVVRLIRISRGLEPHPQRKVVKGDANGKKTKRALETLEKVGVKIFGLESEDGESCAEILSWDTIAGYHEQKREIEDNILLALKRPEVYDSIARGTRHRYESNRPRAVLFDGPPGCGKTSCARVIASQAGVPLLYVPLEVLTSKYYGESERLLSSVLTAGNDFPDGAIVFLDEIDALATTRDTDMHEATRRMLSVLLRQMDGFEQDQRVVLIAATNRKQDLDPALLSRFDASITFELPDAQTRQEIIAQYAQHLTPEELAAVAALSDGMSGRDLRDVCQHAERKWASKVIQGLVGNPPTHYLPPVQEYVDSTEKRRRSLVKLGEDQVSSQSSRRKLQTTFANYG